MVRQVSENEKKELHTFIKDHIERLKNKGGLPREVNSDRLAHFLTNALIENGITKAEQLKGKEKELNTTIKSAAVLMMNAKAQANPQQLQKCVNGLVHLMLMPHKLSQKVLEQQFKKLFQEMNKLRDEPLSNKEMDIMAKKMAEPEASIEKKFGMLLHLGNPKGYNYEGQRGGVIKGIPELLDLEVSPFASKEAKKELATEIEKTPAANQSDILEAEKNEETKKFAPTPFHHTPKPD